MKKSIKKQVNITPYLTLRANVIAKYYYEAKTRLDLIESVKLAKQLNTPLFIIGGGSNIAPKKDIINGLVVRNLYRDYQIIKETKNSVQLLVASGTNVTNLIRKTTEAGFKGFEYHLGLPGTVGGALYMNSKWTKPVRYFGDNLLWANLLDSKGKIKKVNRSYFQFGYDFSILQKTKEIVLEACFLLKKSTPDLLIKKGLNSMEFRKITQPKGVASCGCFFRNLSDKEKDLYKLDTKSAGYLIDKCGFKGYKIGDFTVSKTHANFIINEKKGKSEPRDLVKLIKVIKDKVKKTYGVELREEVVWI